MGTHTHTHTQTHRHTDTQTHRHTDTHWPLDITIIHSLAILRQKHNTIRWEIPNSQLKLIKCPIYVVTMNSYSLNTIANLPSPCQLILGHNHFHLFNMCMFAVCSCILLLHCMASLELAL